MGTPLKSVEVRLDEGPWQTATLDSNVNPYAWTFITLETEALPPGEHTIVSRATDQSGQQQLPEVELNQAKRTNWENNGQFIRRIRVS